MRELQSTSLSYFPGCSLATSARENDASLIRFFEILGIELIELEDWNCCGSSSVHAIKRNLAVMLPARNLSMAPEGRPLLVACPSCLLRLKIAFLTISKDPLLQALYEKSFGRPFDPGLKIMHVFDLLAQLEFSRISTRLSERLDGLCFAPYYGCMLSLPPAFKNEAGHHGLMEKILKGTGARPVSWGYASQCCGTFLSAVRPELVTNMVNDIMADAKSFGADCIVTACAMCHLNLELRCKLPEPVPVFHFSEVLGLAAGEQKGDEWFARHMIDSRPLLEKTGISYSFTD